MHLGLRLFLPFSAGYFLSYLLRNVNAVIAPELARELGVSAADLGLLTSAYLLAFSAFQLPLGVLLDRYGPRRVEAGLLLVAAAGCAWFSVGSSLAELALARAAIGLGVCACLMAAFKAFSVWYPIERLPSLNAAVMVAGGLGALAASTPLAWAVPVFGWRGLFLVLSGLTVLAALAIFATPEKPGASAGSTLIGQFREMIGVLCNAAFWRYPPMTATGLGGFVALQGLWAVPWLMEVGGHTRETAAFHILLTTVAMVGGFLCTALFIGPLHRRGWPPGRVMVIGNALGLLVMLFLWRGIGSSHLLWSVLGMSFAVGNVAYAEITSRFGPALAGRVNAALNLCTFVGAFVIQWGYGVIVDRLEAAGWTLVQSHRAAFGMLLALQAAGFAWYLWRPRASAVS